MNRLYLCISLTLLGCLSVVFGCKKNSPCALAKAKTTTATKYLTTVTEATSDVQDEFDGGLRIKTPRLSNPKKEKRDYEELIREEIKATEPSVDEVVKRTHDSGFYNLASDRVADELCDDDDPTCEDNVIMWAAAPKDPKLIADKKKSRMLRDKQIANAVKEGTASAEKELKQYGPDPYGGALLPAITKDEAELGSEASKKRLAEEKGSKTFKGARSSKPKDKDQDKDKGKDEDKGKDGKVKNFQSDNKDKDKGKDDKKDKKDKDGGKKDKDAKKAK